VRDQPGFLKMATRLLCYPVVNGAYTELWAAFSPDVGIGREMGDWRRGWGRFLSPLFFSTCFICCW